MSHKGVLFHYYYKFIIITFPDQPQNEDEKSYYDDFAEKLQL